MFSQPPSIYPTDTTPHHVLVATLGASWAVVPEIIGWLAPDWLDIYAHHPESAKLAHERIHTQLHAPSIVHIVTTEGQLAQSSVDNLLQWWQLIGQPFALNRPGFRGGYWVQVHTDTSACLASCL